MLNVLYLDSVTLFGSDLFAFIVICIVYHQLKRSILDSIREHIYMIKLKNFILYTFLEPFDKIRQHVFFL